MKRRLTRAEINHLRRLIGWIACEIGQEPDEYIATMREIAPVVGEVSEQGIARLRKGLIQSASVPAYVRAALKALRKTIAENDVEIIDSAPVHSKKRLIGEQS